EGFETVTGCGGIGGGQFGHDAFFCWQLRGGQLRRAQNALLLGQLDHLLTLLGRCGGIPAPPERFGASGEKRRLGDGGGAARRARFGAVDTWPIPLRHRVPSLAVRPSQDGGPGGLIVALLLSPLARWRFAGGWSRLPVHLYHAESDPVRLLYSSCR